MNIPYDKLRLKIALVRLNKNKFIQEKLEEFKKKTEHLFAKEEEINQRIAEDNDMTVNDLIKSPNYKILYEKFFEKEIIIIRESIKKEFDLSDLESWAIAVGIMGAI